jgi:hypothetical protein
MPKCFVTGVEILLEDAFILNRGEAYRAVKELRSKLKALEKLVTELGNVDRVELPNRRTGKTFIKFYSRLVCFGVAKTLSSIYPEKKLFIRWPEWKARRKEIFRNLRCPEGEDVNKRKTNREEGGNGADG